MSSSRSLAAAAFAIGIGSLVGCGALKKDAKLPVPPPPQVLVTRPVTFPVQRYWEYNGYLDAVETVQVKARVQGFLTEVHFQEGTEVHKGDPLYTIEPDQYFASFQKAEADLEKASAELSKAKSDLERSRKAERSGAASPEDVTAKDAAEKSAAAVVAQARAARRAAELELSYTEISAPIDGRISRTLVTRGNLVGLNEATLLTTIVKMDPLYVFFDVPERDLVAYQQGMREKNLPPPTSGKIGVEVGVATESGYPHPGTIDFRENRVDTGTGTVRIRGILPNKDRVLYPGLYARVRVPEGGPKPRLVIPEEALMAGQEGRYVFVLESGTNNVVKRSVEVGTRLRAEGGQDGKDDVPAGGWALIGGKDGKGRMPVKSMVAIEKGLTADDRVIVEGLQRARPGSPAAPDEWKLESTREKK